MKQTKLRTSRRVITVATLATAALIAGTAVATDAHPATKPAAPAPTHSAGTIARPGHASNAPVVPVPTPGASASHPAPAAQPVATQPAPAVGAPTPSVVPMKPADDPVPADDADFYVREAALQREQALLQLEAGNAKLKKSIADAEDSSASIPPPPVIVAPPASMTPQSGVVGAPAASTISSVSIPDASPHGASGSDGILRLASVLGVGGDYQAVIYDHGVQNIVHEGSTLSDGWRIVQLAPSTAVLERGRAHKILHVSGG